MEVATIVHLIPNGWAKTLIRLLLSRSAALVYRGSGAGFGEIIDRSQQLELKLRPLIEHAT